MQRTTENNEVVVEGWATLSDVRDHLQMSTAAIYRLLDQGMPSQKIGKSRRFKLSEVDRWITSELGCACIANLADEPASRAVA